MRVAVELVKAADGDADAVRFSCQDQGAGMSEATLRLLCTEGMQFNANELQGGGGSGLGLFITKAWPLSSPSEKRTCIHPAPSCTPAHPCTQIFTMHRASSPVTPAAGSGRRARAKGADALFSCS